MRRKLKLLIALAGACCAFSTCATTNPTVKKVSGVIDCTAHEVVSQLPAIVAEVATDLLSKDYVALLEDVGKRVGTDAMVCAVKASADGAEQRMSTTPGEQPNAAAIRAHASDYLRLKDARFVEPSAASPGIGAALAICRPACDSCHVCFQVASPPGQLIPPTCAPRSPKPAGCP